MEQKLEYLKKYTMRKDGYIRLIPDEEIIHIGMIPESWLKIFGEKVTQKRIEILLDLWKDNLGIELRNTISYLSEYLENIELMEINQRYSILYTIRNRSGQIMYYEGRNPLENFNNKYLEDIWINIPNSIQNFYNNIHNGVYYYASGSMGLVPKEDVAYLGDDDFDWGILDDLEEPLQIDLSTSFGFFSNGMGTYVAIDYKNCNGDKATLWSAKDQPEYNINFWDYVDEWIVIGFE